MKFPQVVALVCCLILVDSSAGTESNEQDLKARASAQLERLAPYRRSSPDPGTPIDQSQSLETSSNDPVSTNLDERQMALEIYQILPEDLQEDIVRRGSIAVLELLENPKYMALMQERIKRSGERNTGYEKKRDEYSYSEYDRPPEGHPPEGYGEYPPEPYGGGGDTYGQPANSGSDSGGIIQGSSSLIGGIAKGIISGLVSASGSASTGSSSVSASSSAQTSSSSAASSAPQKKPEYQPYGQYGYYGPPAHPYVKKEFSVWDFKKAIISTLMQAVKAISGGVIALKGQLIKGGGYLVSSKGKMIAKAGDVITSLGTNIAKNAANPPAPAHPEYYEHHPEGGHEESYDGPPPGIEEYSDPNDGYHANLNYDSPSDVDDHAGLLIAKPSHPEDHDDHATDVDPRKPSLTHPNDNYHGPPPELDEKDVENTVSGHGDHKPSSHPGESPHHLEHPPSSYEVPSHQYLFDDSKKGIAQEYPLYPPLIGGPPAGIHNSLSIQQSVEYPPVHIRYTVPIKGNLKVPLEDTSSNDLSVYGSLSIDSEPEIESTKVHTANQVGGFELPKLQPYDNFHSLPGLQSTYPGAALQTPLKAPLLNPYMTPYWQNQGLFQPFAGFDMYNLYRRRNSLHRRRSVNDVLRQMRLSRA
ncbi:uncharacterized protein LOC143208283 [Lasioglossum baleicum]|uniref:uncharacterized protein LOC143208283 n=1 Tax=Lasioglossum baleicum TaxID=434251 RepID=UPI003FCE027F